MSAIYNEIDPAAAHVLRHMIAEGVIAPGIVIEKSIKEIEPHELDGFAQVHLFAGGGLWSVAARLAGWPDDEPIWTGSCPCQPFSAAGKGLGTDDPRHLWPDFHRLIRACRPAVVMGEQVAGKAGYGWFDGVRADLAGEGYAGRATDFPACSVDAPHQRNRLYWIAVEEPDGGRQEGRSLCGPGEGDSAHEQWSYGEPGRSGGGERRALDHGIGAGLEGLPGHGDGSGRPQQSRSVATTDGAEPAGQMADHVRNGDGAAPRHYRGEEAPIVGVDGDTSRSGIRVVERDAGSGRNGTYWSDAEWLVCHDGKARRAEPSIRLLVDGLPGRVDLWRVGGNAIVPEAAAEVIAAFMDAYGLPSEWRAAD